MEKTTDTTPPRNFQEWEQNILTALPDVIADARQNNEPFWDIDDYLTRLTLLRRKYGDNGKK